MDELDSETLYQIIRVFDCGFYLDAEFDNPSDAFRHLANENKFHPNYNYKVKVITHECERTAEQLKKEIDRLEEVVNHTYDELSKLKQEHAEAYERENAPKYVKCGTWKWGDSPFGLSGKFVRSMGNRKPAKEFVMIDSITISERHYSFNNEYGNHIYWSMNDQPAVDLYEEVKSG